MKQFLFCLFLAISALSAQANEPCTELPDTAIGAALDDPIAIYDLAVEFYTGKCVEQNYEHAAHLWGKAAAAGIVPAKNNLGYLLSKGLGVEQDQARAAVLWLEAARAGHSESQVHLGDAIFYGHGVPQDQARGLAWILFATKSAKHRADDPEGGGGHEIVEMAEKEKSEMLDIAPHLLTAAERLMGDLGVSGHER